MRRAEIWALWLAIGILICIGATCDWLAAKVGRIEDRAARRLKEMTGK